MKTGSDESDVRDVRGEGGEAILGCREDFSDFFNKSTVSWQSKVQSVKYCCFPLLSFFFFSILSYFLNRTIRKCHYTLKNVLLNRLWSPGDNCKPTSDTWDTEHSEQ